MTSSSSAAPVADQLARLAEAVAFVRGRSPLAPRLGVVAGSGLGAIGELIADPVVLPYREIPHMYAPTVVGHSGQLLLGTLEGLPVAVLSGRVHAYEGHAMSEVVFGVRLLARLGTPRVLLTNAAGGVQPWFAPGSLCRIVDHLNLSGQNPLTGPNLAELGPRFPDMSHGYCPELGAAIQRAAATAGVPLYSGVYAAMSGPSYETPAEVRMLRTLGAAVVGMSTAVECIALNHMGVKVGGISVVSNFAAGVSAATLDHSEVAEVAAEAGPRLLAIIRTLARQLATESAGLPG